MSTLPSSRTPRRRPARAAVQCSGAATRGKKIKPDILADVVGTSLDQGDQLDALAKLPDEKQRELADAAQAGEKVSAKEQITRVRDLAQEEPIRDAASVDLMIKLDISRVQDFANFCREHEIRVFVHSISGFQRADFKSDIATIATWIAAAQDVLKSSFS